MSKTMKRARCLLAFLAAAVLAFALAGTALAADPPSTPSITIETTSTTGEAAIDTTAYTWYRILEADIEEDPSQSGPDQSGGKVAYYVDTQDKVDARRWLQKSAEQGNEDAKKELQNLLNKNSIII